MKEDLNKPEDTEKREGLSDSSPSACWMTLDKAEELAKKTAYAHELCDCEGKNPVDWADAAAFFAEGYDYAMRLITAKKDDRWIVGFIKKNNGVRGPGFAEWEEPVYSCHMNADNCHKDTLSRLI